MSQPTFYGLIGAHRVGKTTLGKGLAERLCVAFYATEISQAMRELGIDPQVDLPFEERLDVQERLLDVLLAFYARVRTETCCDTVVVDRTPLDVLAYTMSEVRRETLKHAAINDRMRAFTDRCYEATNFIFQGMCVVQPGIPIVADPSKGVPNVIYQEAVAAQMLGAANHPKNMVKTLLLPRKCLDRQSRISKVEEHLRAILSRETCDADRTFSPLKTRIN